MRSQMLYAYGQTHKFLDDDFDKIMYEGVSPQSVNTIRGKVFLKWWLKQLRSTEYIENKRLRERKHFNELLEEYINTPLNKRVVFVTKERLEQCINI